MKPIVGTYNREQLLSTTFVDSIDATFQKYRD